jgi:TonB family protein
VLSIFLSVLLAQAAAPAAQAQAEVSGEVILECDVARQGVLERCEVVSETPPGRGFRRVAMLLSQTMRLPSRVGQRVRAPVPLRFSAAEADALGIIPESAPPLVQNAEWVRRPDAKQFKSFYPEAARRRGAAGYSLVQCVVGGNGNVGSCRVLQETPAGLGFGAQALKITEALFRMAPSDLEGRSTAGRPVNVPITWVLAP